MRKVRGASERYGDTLRPGTAVGSTEECSRVARGGTMMYVSHDFFPHITM